MTRKIPTLAALALLVFGCSRSGKMQRDQKQYDVVQEGSASGVTSTINAPGETKPPVTDTNADTTTAFTIPTNPNPLGNDTVGTAVSGPTWISAPRPPRPHVTTAPRPQELQPAPATDTTMTTDTDIAPVPTTTTDTQRSPKATTTSPDVKKKPDEEPPPPPTTTDTRG
jgi:hypothetical protein